MDKIRHLIQLFFTFAINANFKGFITGTVYRAKSKGLCVPVLNCYSCPGALGSCPIGSLQAVIGHAKHKVSLYLTGFFIAVGSLMGRLPCGYACPFGFFQDLLHKIKIKKVKVSYKSPFIYLKYVILVIFVILMPMFLVNAIGYGAPAFCKWICPQGTFSAGFPLLYVNTNLRVTIGYVFYIKVVALLAVIIASIKISRPFCRYICPLGAILGMFNRISIYHLSVDKDKCINCKKCERVCPMGIATYETPNSAECIRCNRCVKSCPTSALKIEMNLKGEFLNENNKKGIACSSACSSCSGVCKNR